MSTPQQYRRALPHQIESQDAMLAAALHWIETLEARLAHPQPALPMQDWINQWPGLTDDDHTRMRAAWSAGYHAGQQALQAKEAQSINSRSSC